MDIEINVTEIITEELDTWLCDYIHECDFDKLMDIIDKLNLVLPNDIQEKVVLERNPGMTKDDLPF